MESKNKVGRPRQGKQSKKKYSVTMEPWMREAIISRYGTLSGGLDAICKDWLVRREKLQESGK